MRRLILTALAALALVPTSGAVSPYVNYGGGGGGGQLPACTRAWWTIEIDGVQGHDWLCPWDGDHWVILR